MEDLKYKEWLKAKREARADFSRISQYRRDMANTMYLILNREHKGKGCAICADALAEKMSEELGTLLNRGHVSECARLFREYGNFPSLQSSSRGYYVDDSFEAMVATLRFVYKKSLQIEYTATNIRSIICKKYGPKAVPEDLRSWLEALEYEEWCRENDIDKDQ